MSASAPSWASRAHLDLRSPHNCSARERVCSIDWACPAALAEETNNVAESRAAATCGACAARQLRADASVILRRFLLRRTCSGSESPLCVGSSAIALDPTQSGLSLPEQVRRSKNLLRMTLASARSCLAAQAPQVAAALDSATLLVSSASAAGQAQSIEQTLSLAEQLWGLRRSRCAREAQDGALALIHNRIAQ